MERFATHRGRVASNATPWASAVGRLHRRRPLICRRSSTGSGVADSSSDIRQPRIPDGSGCRFDSLSKCPRYSHADERNGRGGGAGADDLITPASPSVSGRVPILDRCCRTSSQASACGVSPDPPACRAEAEAPVAGSILAVSTMRSLEARSLSSGMRRRREKFGVWPAGCLAC